MTKNVRAAAALLAIAAIAAAGCDSVTGGPKKIIFNETICANQAVVRMTQGTTYRIVLDNETNTPNQGGMTVRISDVPLVIQGDVPKNSIVGDPLSTVSVSAPANEEARVDVVPSKPGTFPIQCGVIVGGRSEVFDMTLQIVPE